MLPMRRIFCAPCLVLLLAAPVSAAETSIKLSTTTSTQASGLLDVLLPEFTKASGIVVKVIAKGTGAAIRDGQDGNVDVILVHAKSREEGFVKAGHGTRRYAVMHNDFVIVGPRADPARVRSCKTVICALRRIARARAHFVSRGDDSGTHGKEQQLWRKTRLPLANRSIGLAGKAGKRVSVIRPGGKWYLSIGMGMGRTLTFANEKQAYTLTDRGTFVKYRHGRKRGIDLSVLLEGDPLLHNPYGVIPVNPGRHPHVNHKSADRFARWLIGQRAQRLIASYRVQGRQLFFPDNLSSGAKQAASSGAKQAARGHRP